jgi:hypothetical protein
MLTGPAPSTVCPSCVRTGSGGLIARVTRAESSSLDDNRPMCAFFCSLQDPRWELEAFELSRRGAFSVKVIHLLQSQALGLWDDEERPDCRQD